MAAAPFLMCNLGQCLVRADDHAVRSCANKKTLQVPAGRLNAPCSGFLGRLDGHHHEAWDCSGVPLLPSGGRRFLYGEAARAHHCDRVAAGVRMLCIFTPLSR